MARAIIARHGSATTDEHRIDGATEEHGYMGHGRTRINTDQHGRTRKNTTEDPDPGLRIPTVNSPAVANQKRFSIEKFGDLCINH